MIVERMRWWDLDEVVAVEQQAFAADPPWSVEQLWAELAGMPDARHYVVARGPSTLDGYAGLAVGPDTADVMTLAVRAGRRRRGIGAALLDELLAEAARRGLREVLLEVRADNEPALRLYARAGFEQVARRRGYYPDGTDGLVLRRRVPHG